MKDVFEVTVLEGMRHRLALAVTNAWGTIITQDYSEGSTCWTVVARFPAGYTVHDVEGGVRDSLDEFTGWLHVEKRA